MRRLLPPEVHGAEVQDMHSMPGCSLLWEEEELQRLRRVAESETDAEVIGWNELFPVRGLQVRYLHDRGRRRSHLREGGAEKEPRSLAGEEEHIHMWRLPFGGEEHAVAQLKECKVSRRSCLISPVCCGLSSKLGGIQSVAAPFMKTSLRAQRMTRVHIIVYHDILDVTANACAAEV